MERARELFERLQQEGEKAIDAFIASRQYEELFLDFKRSSDRGAGTALSQEDRNHLAKAISGFGNSEGGVIVWGVDCSRDQTGADVARMKQPLHDPVRFVSWLQSVVSGSTVPVHGTVEHICIPTNADGIGYVATLIPQSDLAPHQAVFNHQYYMRTGSNFMPVPHGVLAGMFGRRPQPKMFLMHSVGPARRVGDSFLLSIGLMVTNDGRGIARDIFLNHEVWPQPGPNCELSFELTDKQHWLAQMAFGIKLNVISTPDTRLAPHNFFQPVVVNAQIKPPFTREMKQIVRCGCENAPIFDGTLISSPAQMAEVYAKLLASPDLSQSQDLVSRFFGIPEPLFSKDR